MKKQARPTYTAEFKLEAAQLVLDQNYSVKEAAQAMGVSKSAMDKWVRQIKTERADGNHNPSPLTADKIKIKELERKIKRIELENKIIKKATALLISDSLKNLK
ncbi:MAG: transposase [Psychromonas sp.]|nr:transposase [Psychromonas sp.]